MDGRSAGDVDHSAVTFERPKRQTSAARLSGPGSVPKLVYIRDVVMARGLSRDITRCVAQVAEQGSFAAAQGVTTFLFPIRFEK